MRISALGSGSKGNSTLLQAGSTTLMVDCGFGIRETERRLAELDIDPLQIDAILVTHEHQDHIVGVEPLAAKYGLRVCMTMGTARAWKSRGRVSAEFIYADQEITLGEFQIRPVAVPHDAREPVQFVFSYGEQKVGVLTDLGSLTPHILEAYRDCHALLVEANHDLKMLQEGPYPFALKKRVSGDWGHLNNGQTAEFVSQVSLGNTLKHLIVGHISEQNNHIDLAAQALESPSIFVENILFASQDKPLGWIELS